MICVGSGQQRYTFKEEQGFRHDANIEQVPKRCGGLAKEDSLAKISFAYPCNNLTLLTHAFVDTMKLSTDLRYNLAWTYGFFLEDVPRRLGSNEALDTSADALASAHLSYCTHRVVSVEVLRKYSNALSKLRICLDDPMKACTSDTLCAVSLLLICQVSKSALAK
jgi:hypothetical protein